MIALQRLDHELYRVRNATPRHALCPSRAANFDVGCRRSARRFRCRRADAAAWTRAFRRWAEWRRREGAAPTKALDRTLEIKSPAQG
jgi:hypothetical protein